MLENPSQSLRRLVGLSHRITLILSTDEQLSEDDLRDLQDSLEEMFFTVARARSRMSQQAPDSEGCLLSLRLQE